MSNPCSSLRGGYVVHDRRGGAVLGQDDGLAASPDSGQQLAGFALEFTETDDGFAHNYRMKSEFSQILGFLAARFKSLQLPDASAQPGARCAVSEPVQAGSPVRAFGPRSNKLRPSYANGARDATRCGKRIFKSPFLARESSAEPASCQ